MLINEEKKTDNRGKDLLKLLTETNGFPGYEKDVREVLKSELSGYVDQLYTDRMGNLIAVKNEAATGPHLALCAHMDEVGLMVRWIDASGLIRFESWGVDLRVLVSKVVKIGPNKITGVIGSKPIHKQKPEEREKAHSLDNLYIDIGTTTKADTEKLVSIGDYVAFDSPLTEFGEHKLKGKAFDDRVGCAVLTELLKSDTKNKITAVFSVQEEVGTRGAAVAANRISADLVLIVEGTICADTSGVDPHNQVTVQGKGPVVSLVDRGSIYLKPYVDSVIKVAEANGLPWQYRKTGMGGTDATRYHTAKGGTPVIGLAVPVRYIHSPVSVLDFRDYENLVKLVKKYEEAFATLVNENGGLYGR